MATLQIPITVQLQLAPISEMPVSVPIDFSQHIPVNFTDTEVLDLFSLRLFECIPDGGLEKVPVQFSPDRLGSFAGTLYWRVGGHPTGAVLRDFLLYVDISEPDPSGQTTMTGAIYGHKLFEKNGDAKKLPHFPHMQAVPGPGSTLSIQREGVEVLGYHYGDYGEHSVRPYFFPLIGPSGRCVTRIGHPHDPVGHRHHYSIWLAYHNVNSVNFWDDRSTSGRQRHQRFLALSDGSAFAGFTAIVHWQDASGKPLMEETKRVSVCPLPGNELLIDFRFTFTPITNAVALEKTQFGFLGVRVAKTMGVFDGSGRIQNAVGAINEKAIFWNRARWCDYSGPITEAEWNGIAIFDHPTNPNHPSHWHVRSDGWMSPCLFLENGQTIAPGTELMLNYRLFVHAGDAVSARVQDRYAEYIQEPCIKVGAPEWRRPD